ncbi:MAG: DinB family protein [Planctomycetota bacterium]|nr:DinB family protein [Planctomycetota bacterium]
MTLFRSIEAFIGDMEEEACRTRALLGRLTDESLGTRVAPGLRGLGEMAWHLAQSLGSIGSQLGLLVDAPLRDAPPPAHGPLICDAYDRAVNSLCQAVLDWDDGALIEVVDVYGERWTRGHALRVMLDHEIHHRGECVVLMRQAGLEPPALYGPVLETVPDPFDANEPASVERLERRIVVAWRIENVIWWAILTVGAVAAEWFWLPELEWWPLAPWWGAALISAAMLCLAIVWPSLAYAAWSYSVRRHDVMLSYGVLFRVRRSLPRPRIQHVDVRSGPLDRAFGLVKCTLYTAGTGEADASIPGLVPEVAEALRERLLAQGPMGG